MKTKTMVKVIIGIVVIGGGLGFFMYQAMQSSWSYYYSVDEFLADPSAAKDVSVRIAGAVKEGSVVRDLKKMKLTFTLAGAKAEVPVSYGGAVPDSFEEGREVVVEGRLDAAGIFQAEVLMTRCESKYKKKLE